MRPLIAFVAGSLAGLALTTQVHANEIAFAFSDHSVEADYSAQNSGQSSTSARWLHHEDNGDLMSLGLYGEGSQGVLSGKLGGFIYYTDIGDKYGNGTGHGIAVGGESTYNLGPQLSWINNLHYSPSVISYGDIEHLVVFNTQLKYHVFEGTSVMVGYRHAEMKIVNAFDFSLHEGAYLGLSIDL